MKNISAQNEDHLEFLEEILREIKKKGNLLGVFVSYRDGNLVLCDIEEEYDCETFAAMGASVIASAETLGYSIKNQKFHKLIAELEEKTLLIYGVSKQIFIFFIFNDNSNIDLILKDIDKYCKRMIKLF